LPFLLKDNQPPVCACRTVILSKKYSTTFVTCHDQINRGRGIFSRPPPPISLKQSESSAMKKFLLAGAVIWAGYAAVSNGLVTFTPAPGGMFSSIPDITLTLECAGAEADGHKKVESINQTHAQVLSTYHPLGDEATVDEVLRLNDERSEDWNATYERIHLNPRRDAQQGRSVFEDDAPKYL
jgi:hypothetical protein